MACAPLPGIPILGCCPPKSTLPPGRYQIDAEYWLYHGFNHIWYPGIPFPQWSNCDRWYRVETAHYSDDQGKVFDWINTMDPISGDSSTSGTQPPHASPAYLIYNAFSETFLSVTSLNLDPPYQTYTITSTLSGVFDSTLLDGLVDGFLAQCTFEAMFAAGPPPPRQFHVGGIFPRNFGGCQYSSSDIIGPFGNLQSEALPSASAYTNWKDGLILAKSKILIVGSTANQIFCFQDQNNVTNAITYFTQKCGSCLVMPPPLKTCCGSLPCSRSITQNAFLVCPP